MRASISSPFTQREGLATFTIDGIYKFNLKVATKKGLVQNFLKEITVSATNIAPIAKIYSNFTSGEEAISIKFDALESSDEDGYVKEYHWDFGNGESSTESEVEVLYEGIGEYIVVLSVVDNYGTESTSSKIISVTEPSEPSTSEYRLSLNEIENNFYGISDSIVLTLDGQFHQESPDVTVVLNDQVVPANMVSIDENKIIISGGSTIGLNTLEVHANDEFNKVIRGSFPFLAGNKTLSIFLNSTSLNTFNSTNIQIVDQTGIVVLSNNFDSSDISINNFPDGAYSIFGVSGNEHGKASFIVSDNTNLNINFERFSDVSDIDNNDFSKGLSGWDVENINSFDVDDEGRLTLDLSEGTTVIERTFSGKLGHSYSLSISTSGLELEDNVLATITNISTRDSRIVNLSSQEELAESIESLLIGTSGETNEINVRLEIKTPVKEVSFLEQIVPKAFAQDSTNPDKTFSLLLKKHPYIYAIGLHDRGKSKSSKNVVTPLDLISLGKLVTQRGGANLVLDEVPINGVLSMFSSERVTVFELRAIQGSSNVAKACYIVAENCATQADFDAFQDIGGHVVDSTSEIFRFSKTESENIKRGAGDTVNLYLYIKTIGMEKADRLLLGKFPILFAYDYKDATFTLSDKLVGHDIWVQSAAMDNIHSLYEFSNKKKISAGMQIGDRSNMHGGQFDHATHRSGLDVDVKLENIFDGGSGRNEVFEFDKMYEYIKKFGAISLSNEVNQVFYGPGTGESISEMKELNSVLLNTCLDNGRIAGGSSGSGLSREKTTANNFFHYTTKDHNDHIHFKFNGNHGGRGSSSLLINADPFGGGRNQRAADVIAFAKKYKKREVMESPIKPVISVQYIDAGEGKPANIQLFNDVGSVQSGITKLFVVKNKDGVPIKGKMGNSDKEVYLTGEFSQSIPSPILKFSSPGKYIIEVVNFVKSSDGNVYSGCSKREMAIKVEEHARCAGKKLVNWESEVIPDANGFIESTLFQKLNLINSDGELEGDLNYSLKGGSAICDETVEILPDLNEITPVIEEGSEISGNVKIEGSVVITNSRIDGTNEDYQLVISPTVKVDNYISIGSDSVIKGATTIRGERVDIIGGKLTDATIFGNLGPQSESFYIVNGTVQNASAKGFPVIFGKVIGPLGNVEGYSDMGSDEERVSINGNQVNGSESGIFDGVFFIDPKAKIMGSGIDVEGNMYIEDGASISSGVKWKHIQGESRSQTILISGSSIGGSGSSIVMNTGGQVEIRNKNAIIGESIIINVSQYLHITGGASITSNTTINAPIADIVDINLPAQTWNCPEGLVTDGEGGYRCQESE